MGLKQICVVVVVVVVVNIIIIIIISDILDFRKLAVIQNTCFSYNYFYSSSVFTDVIIFQNKMKNIIYYMTNINIISITEKIIESPTAKEVGNILSYNEFMT